MYNNYYKFLGKVDSILAGYIREEHDIECSPTMYLQFLIQEDSEELAKALISEKYPKLHDMICIGQVDYKHSYGYEIDTQMIVVELNNVNYALHPLYKAAYHLSENGLKDELTFDEDTVEDFESLISCKELSDEMLEILEDKVERITGAIYRGILYPTNDLVIGNRYSHFNKISHWSRSLKYAIGYAKEMEDIEEFKSNGRDDIEDDDFSLCVFKVENANGIDIEKLILSQIGTHSDLDMTSFIKEEEIQLLDCDFKIVKIENLTIPINLTNPTRQINYPFYFITLEN